MSRGYDRDIILENRFSRIIRAILGLQFFTQREWEDQNEGTDFAVFSSGPVRVAVRLRRNKFLLSYPNDITVRWSRPSGIRTEIHKIREGLVNHMLYGFVSSDEGSLVMYSIISLNPFPESPISVHKNNPPDSELAVFKVNQFRILKAWRGHEGHSMARRGAARQGKVYLGIDSRRNLTYTQHNTQRVEGT